MLRQTSLFITNSPVGLSPVSPTSGVQSDSRLLPRHTQTRDGGSSRLTLTSLKATGQFDQLVLLPPLRVDVARRGASCLALLAADLRSYHHFFSSLSLPFPDAKCVLGRHLGRLASLSPNLVWTCHTWHQGGKGRKLKLVSHCGFDNEIRHNILSTK